jgi:hypothetical protein
VRGMSGHGIRDRIKTMHLMSIERTKAYRAVKVDPLIKQINPEKLSKTVGARIVPLGTCLIGKSRPTETV